MFSRPLRALPDISKTGGSQKALTPGYNLPRLRREDGNPNVKGFPTHYTMASRMPGVHRAIQIQVEDAGSRGERPRVVVEGFNVGR